MNVQKSTAPPETKAAFAKRWAISTRSVDRLLAQGLPAIKLGHRTLRIVPQSADEYLLRKFGV